jgi:NitT/TauT family transport system substrate-binding protein
MRLGMVFALCAALLAGCGKQAPPQPRQVVILACTAQPQGTLVQVALAKGYFLEQGLDVRPQLHPFGKLALQSLVEGKADVATAADAPIMFQAVAGQQLRVLATLVSSSTNNGVVALRSAGIAGIRDLKGKRVGYTTGTTSDYFLSSLLATQGLTRQDVPGLPMAPAEMLRALETDKVDAVSTWNYTLSAVANALGPRGVVLLDARTYTETFNLVGSDEFVRHRGDVVERLLRALIQAEDFVRQQPQQAQAIMAAASHVDLPLVQQVWPVFRFQVWLEPNLLNTLRDETRWAMGAGLVKPAAVPDYRNYVYLDGLRAVGRLPAEGK